MPLAEGSGGSALKGQHLIQLRSSVWPEDLNSLRGGEKHELLVQNGLPEATERQKQGGRAALSAARCVPSSEKIVSLSKNIHLVL